MSALKGVWTVHVGLFPGEMESMEKHHRVWYYTTKEYEEDIARPEDAEGESHFQRMMREAHEYSQSVTNPARLNWVRCEFAWM